MLLGENAFGIVGNDPVYTKRFQLFNIGRCIDRPWIYLESSGLDFFDIVFIQRSIIGIDRHSLQLLSDRKCIQGIIFGEDSNGYFGVELKKNL